MAPGHPSRLQRWLGAALIGAGAVASRALLQPILHDQLAFLVAFPATVVAALLCGAGPGVITAAICAAAVAAGFAPELDPALRPIQCGGFMVAAAVIALACDQFGAGPHASIDRKASTFGPAAASAAPSPAAPDTRLTSWLRAVLIGSFLIPALTFVAVAWWGYQNAKSEAIAVATQAASLAHRQAQRTFATAAEVARRADAASAGDDDAIRRDEEAIHKRLADIVAGLTSTVNISVWNAEGQLLLRSDRYPVDRSASMADRSFFQQARTSGDELAVSEAVVGRQSGAELMNVILRRTSVDGRFHGVVAVSLSPQFFRDYYRSLASEDANLATFALIRSDGEILARWPSSPDGRRQVPPDNPTLRRVQAGERSGSHIVGAAGSREARVISFQRVDPYPLYVTAGFRRDAMLASWARFVAMVAAIVVPTTLGLVAVSWVALRRTRELHEETTRRAAAERAMMESQRMETLAVVAGGIAHDFNNLLAVIGGSLHILERKHPDVAQERHVQAMSRALKSGVRLTRQMISFSRKQALRPERLSLQEWLPSVETLLRTTAGSHIAWRVEVAADTRPIHVDASELELALLNLVVNAGHAMPKGGGLVVRAANAGETSAGGAALVAVSVTDDGVGIPSNLLTQVFEPFFTTRPKAVGSGLGLSQVQGFCVQSGGSARIDSREGHGTTVWMFLPATDLPAIEATPAETPDRAALRGTLLLVEDNADLGSTTETLLQGAGLDVVRAPTADAALALLEVGQRKVDVVLSDIVMPGTMSGIQLALELRKRFPELPILLATGYADHLDEAEKAGLTVLPKPVPADVLLGELRKALRRLQAA